MVSRSMEWHLWVPFLPVTSLTIPIRESDHTVLERNLLASSLLL
jgi:hypothetical protein